MKENIPGYPGYHVTRDGKVYSCLIQGGSSKQGVYEKIDRLQVCHTFFLNN